MTSKKKAPTLNANGYFTENGKYYVKASEKAGGGIEEVNKSEYEQSFVKVEKKPRMFITDVNDNLLPDGQLRVEGTNEIINESEQESISGITDTLKEANFQPDVFTPFSFLEEDTNTVKLEDGSSVPPDTNLATQPPKQTEEVTPMPDVAITEEEVAIDQVSNEAVAQEQSQTEPVVDESSVAPVVDIEAGSAEEPIPVENVSASQEQQSAEVSETIDPQAETDAIIEVVKKTKQVEASGQETKEQSDDTKRRIAEYVASIESGNNLTNVEKQKQDTKEFLKSEATRAAAGFYKGKSFVNTFIVTDGVRDLNAQMDLKTPLTPKQLETKNLEEGTAWNSPSTVSAFVASFAEYSIFGSGADYITYRQAWTQTPNEEFKKTLTFDRLNDVIIQENLPVTAISSLMKAENGMHYQLLLALEKESVARLSVINESSHSLTQAVMAGGWMIADPTIFLGITKVPKVLMMAQQLKKLGNLSSRIGTIGASVGTQYLIAEMRSVIDKRYTSDDYILDIFIGGIADGITAPKRLVTVGTQTKSSIGNIVSKVRAERKAVETMTSPDNKGLQPWSKPKGYSWKRSKEASDDFMIKVTQELGEKTAKSIGDLSTDIEKLTEASPDVLARIEEVTKIDQSTGDKLLAKYEKQIGENIEPQKFTMADVERRKNKQKRSKAEKKAAEKHNLNKSSLVELIDKRLAQLRDVVKSAKEKLTPTDPKTVTPEVAAETTRLREAVVTAEKAVADYAEAITKMTRATGKANAKKKLNRLKSELDKANKSEDKFLQGKLSEEQRQVELNKSSLARQQEMYELIGSEIDEMFYELDEAIMASTKNTLRTQAQKDAFALNLTQVISDTLGHPVVVSFNKAGQLITDTPIRLIPDANGNVMLGGSKIPLIVVMTLGSAVAASASDGSFIEIMSVPAMVILALVISVSSIKRIQDKGFATTVADGYNQMKASVVRGDKMTSAAGKSDASFIDDMAEKARTSWLESIATVIKEGTTESVKMVKKLAYDSVNGGGTPAEVAKRHKIRTLMNRYRTEAEMDGFDSWKKRNMEEGTFNDVLDKVQSVYAETTLMKKFRSAVSRCVESPAKCDDPDVAKTASRFKEEIDAMAKEANLYGVHGFSTKDLAKFDENYFPHLWNSSSLKNLYNIADDITPLIEGFQRMIMAGKRTKPITEAEALESATAMVDMFATSGFSIGGKSVRDINKILDSLKKLGVDVSGIKAEDVASGIFDMSEVISRAKHRMLIDTDAFGKVTLKSEGKEIEVDLDYIMERDSFYALERYANEVQGATQVARTTGFGSEAALRAAIAGFENNDEVLAVFDYYIKGIYGKPMYDIGSKLNQNLNTARNLSFFGVLGWVVFSMTPELLKTAGTLIRSGAARRQAFIMMKGIGRNLKEGSSLYQELSGLVGGWGTSMNRLDYRFRGQDDLTSVSDHLANAQGFSGKAHEISAKLKSATIFLSGLAKTSDMMQKIQAVGMAERLAKLAHGVETIGDARKSRYGITDSFLETMKEKLVLKDGELQALDFDSWKPKDQYAFRDVMERMMMNQVQEVTLGGTPMWMHNSSVGRLLMHIMSFTSAMYSNHFIAGVKTRDLEEGMSQILWFAGTYIGLTARYAIQGKEVDDDEMIKRTLLSMPFSASVGVMEGMLDPVALSFSSGVKDNVNAWTLGQIEE